MTPARRARPARITHHLGVAVTYYEDGTMRVWATRRDVATGRYHSELLIALDGHPYRSDRGACGALLGALEVVHGRLAREAQEDVDQLSLFD